MAEVILRLRVDPETGKKHVIVKYHSEADALPMEHEADHKRIVDQLIAKGALKAHELGEIIVERLDEGHEVAPQAEAEAPAAPIAQSVDEG